MKILIDDRFCGISPKNFLKKRLDLPPQRIWFLIDRKQILINNLPIEKNYKFKLGDEVLVLDKSVKLREKFLQKQKSFEYTKTKDLKISKIFENDDFIVLNKPTNVIVQTEELNENSIQFHLNFLKKQNKDNRDFIYRCCHRIDKDTSGILIVSKNEKTLRDFNEIFRERKISKKYLCLTFNSLDKKENLIEIFMRRNLKNAFPKVIVTDKSDKDKTKKLTKTKYKVIKNYNFKNQKFSLVEVDLLTGYTHQIRVCMNYLKCPIVFDKMYGDKFLNEKFNKSLNRQFLHSYKTSFTYKNKKYEFKADLTKDLENFLEVIK